LVSMGNTEQKSDQVRLKRLVDAVKSAPDTPAIISLLAEDHDLLQVVFRILTMGPDGDAALFEALGRVCSEEQILPADLKKRLSPAAQALGLPGPEEPTGDFYKVLGISSDAPESAIRKAYRSKARELHPDIHPHVNPKEFALLAEAYRVLSTPDLREQYDAREKKKVPAWTERSPSYMEEEDRRDQGHQKKTRRLAVQLVLVVVAMLVGVVIANQIFQEQALRQGPYVQTLGKAEEGKGQKSGSRERGAGSKGQESGVGSREAGGREQQAKARKEEAQGAGSREEGKARPSKAPDASAAALAKTSVPDVTGPASGPDDTGSSRPVKVLAKVEDSGIKAQVPTPNEPTRKAESVTVTPSGLGKKVEHVQKEATAEAKVQEPGAKREEPQRKEMTQHGPEVGQPAAAAAGPSVEPRMAEAGSPPATPEERTGEPAAVPLHPVQDFLDDYCRAYETLNYLRFMGFFAKDAVENDTSVKQLEATYRDNFERLDALVYDIQVEELRTHPGEIEVSGNYRLKWRFREGNWQGREGSIVLGLVPVKGSFQVKRLVYK